MTNDKAPRVLTCLALPLVSIVLALLVFEAVARVFLDESPLSYGVLWGRQLPPKSIFPAKSVSETDPHAWHGDLVVDARKITTSDLWGIMAQDPDTGWSPRRGASSTNGWWRSNNLGARSDHDTEPRVPPGKTRVLVFGDSFAQSSRLPQEETWVHRLGQRYPRLELVNFGVDGYGMGQSLLRFRQVQASLDYDAVLFLFVPSADLWRDINTIRYLGAGWELFSITPRFILEDGQLRIAKSPYDSVRRLYQENFSTLTEETGAFLRKHDRFYIPLLYDDPPMGRHFVSYKLLASFLGQWQISALHRTAVNNPASEAWQVTRAIFMSAKILANTRSAKFVLAVLPTHGDLRAARQDESFRLYWEEMVADLGRRGLRTANLLPALSSAPSTRLDRGYDGSHYGPNASIVIADALGRWLTQQAVQ